jgi:hypothetical protein
MRLRTQPAQPSLRVNSEVDSLPHECPRARARLLRSPLPSSVPLCFPLLSPSSFSSIGLELSLPRINPLVCVRVARVCESSTSPSS